MTDRLLAWVKRHGLYVEGPVPAPLLAAALLMLAGVVIAAVVIVLAVR